MVNSKKHLLSYATEKNFLACCAFSNRGGAKFISVALYLFYSGSTISR